MRDFYIIKLGETYPATAAAIGDFEHWIERGMGEPARVVDPRRGGPLPPPERVRGAVLTGSHAMVTEHTAWSEATGRWLAELVQRQVPVLGICYGHQLLAHALGGEVAYHPGGKEIGTVEVRLHEAAAGDPLLGGLPPLFAAQVVHSQSVRRLPAGAVPLAANGFEPHQAFRVGPCAWGVQFHPEFDARAMTAYIRELALSLCEQGRDPARLEAAVCETPAAASLLPRFAKLVQASHTAASAVP